MQGSRFSVAKGIDFGQFFPYNSYQVPLNVTFQSISRTNHLDFQLFLGNFHVFGLVRSSRKTAVLEELGTIHVDKDTGMGSERMSGDTRALEITGDLQKQKKV